MVPFSFFSFLFSRAHDKGCHKLRFNLTLTWCLTEWNGMNGLKVTNERRKEKRKNQKEKRKKYWRSLQYSHHNLAVLYSAIFLSYWHFPVWDSADLSSTLLSPNLNHERSVQQIVHELQVIIQGSEIFFHGKSLGKSGPGINCGLPNHGVTA